jgi:hypothetical protein
MAIAVAVAVAAMLTNGRAHACHGPSAAAPVPAGGPAAPATAPPAGSWARRLLPYPSNRPRGLASPRLCPLGLSLRSLLLSGGGGGGGGRRSRRGSVLMAHALWRAQVKQGYRSPVPHEPESDSAWDVVGLAFHDPATGRILRERVGDFLLRALHGREEAFRVPLPSRPFARPVRVAVAPDRRDAWLAQLANGTEPLAALVRSVPHGPRVRRVRHPRPPPMPVPMTWASRKTRSWRRWSAYRSLWRAPRGWSRCASPTTSAPTHGLMLKGWCRSSCSKRVKTPLALPLACVGRAPC